MKQRIVTGVVAGGLFILMLTLGGFWYFGLILIMAAVGHEEYIKMIGLQKRFFIRFFSLAAAIVLTIPWEVERIGVDFPLESFIWLLMLVLLSVTVITKNKLSIDQAALVFIGIVYLGFGFHYMISTRWLEPDGLFWTFLLFLCIWAADAGAYFSGVAFGKHLLWPAISPKKTIEGAVGGLILSIAVASAFSLYNPDALGLGRAVLLGVVIALAGQMGDLIQSAYKRVKGIKDTGTILPGHGGILDRVDSWLVVFPFVHLLSMIPQ